MPVDLRIRPSSFVTLLLGLILIGCAAEEQTSESPPGEANLSAETVEDTPRNVRVLRVERQDLAESLVISGTLRPTRGADLSAEEAGVVSTVHRDKGAYVEKGEQILSIDRRILSAEKKSALAEEQLHAFNEDRTRTLFDENSVSGQEMLIVHTQSEQAQARAQIAKVRHERASFPAPFAGIISERYVEIGEYISPGTKVARILDPFTLELHGTVTERQVQSIEPGASVRVALSGVDSPVVGTVEWIGFEADPSSGKFPLEIKVENAELILRPGTLGRAEIQTTLHKNVVVIPRDAVVQTTSGPTVFVVDGRYAEQRSVSLGAEQNQLVVARNGVSEGDQLIVRGQRDLSDHAPVKVQETSTRPDGSLDRKSANDSNEDRSGDQR